MRRKLGAWVLTLLAAFSLLLTGCSRSVSVAADAQEEQGPRRLLFVTDDVAQPFSAQAWDALCEAAQAADAQVTLLEVQGQADKASTALNQASDSVYDLIILDRLAGDVASEWVRRNAGYYPSMHYFCLDAAPGETAKLENVSWLVWEDAAAYYICGVLAALNSERQTVAFLTEEGGSRAERRFLAFYAGASQQRAGIRALYVALGKAPGEHELTTALQQLKQEGADTVCTQLEDSSVALLEGLWEKQGSGWLLLGGETDLTALPQAMAAFDFQTSKILKRVLEQCCGGETPTGVQVLEMKNGSLLFMPGDSYPGALSQQEQELLERVKTDAYSGVLDELLPVETDAEVRQQRIAEAAEGKT